MPRPSQRSRSLRRVKTNVPGGTPRVHYLKKRPGMARCRICKGPLHGVPREMPIGVRKLSKSEKRPERPYGGNLCSACTRDIMKRKNMLRWENV